MLCSIQESKYTLIPEPLPLPQIKEITMDNAKLLLQIDNAKLANDDFKNKYVMNSRLI